MRPYFFQVVFLRDLIPDVLFLLAQQAFLKPGLLPSSPPGSQGAAPSQVNRVPSCGTSHGSQSGSHSYFVLVLACSCSHIYGSASGLQSPFCSSAPGGASCPHLPSSGSLSFPHLALPCGSCFLSPTCKLDAGGSLGQAWYGTCDWQCSP